MANIAIKSAFSGAVRLPALPTSLRVLFRYWRRDRLRRRALRALLDKTNNARLLDDIGFATSRRSMLERWAVTMRDHRR